MIIGKIIGGLGNQMFQYTFYEYLSNLKNLNLKVDLSPFENYSLHNGYELERAFGLTLQPASDIECNRLKTKFPISFKVENKILNKNILFGKTHFAERNFYLNPNIFKCNYPDFYVEGYFQTDKYAKHFESFTREAFTFKTQLTKSEHELLTGNCVSIHIRGGDYIGVKANNLLFGGICTQHYYQQAITKIKQLVKNPHFLIFTNDVNHAKSILKHENFKIVNWNTGNNSFRDMYLMSLCKHNIIANSSFSWWGAWLNSHADKIVISPKKWINGDKINQKDVIPSSWVKL